MIPVWHVGYLYSNLHDPICITGYGVYRVYRVGYCIKSLDRIPVAADMPVRSGVHGPATLSGNLGRFGGNCFHSCRWLLYVHLLLQPHDPFREVQQPLMQSLHSAHLQCHVQHLLCKPSSSLSVPCCFLVSSASPPPVLLPHLMVTCYATITHHQSVCNHSILPSSIIVFSVCSMISLLASYLLLLAVLLLVLQLLTVLFYTCASVTHHDIDSSCKHLGLPIFNIMITIAHARHLGVPIFNIMLRVCCVTPLSSSPQTLLVCCLLVLQMLIVKFHSHDVTRVCEHRVLCLCMLMSF